LNNGANLREASPKVCGDATNKPAKTESNFFIRSSSKFEGNRCRDTIIVWHDALNLYSHFVFGIWICPDASLLHDSGNMQVRQEIVSRESTVGCDRLPSWNSQQISTMDAAYSSGHGIKNRVICAAKFLDTEVEWAFVEAEMKVDAGDAAFQVMPMQSRKRNIFVVRCKERKGGAEES
jgi:hypothetical protein